MSQPKGSQGWDWSRILEAGAEAETIGGMLLTGLFFLFLFKDSLARSGPTHSGLSPPTPFINQEDVTPTGTICIRFRKLLFFSVMFSVPLELDSSFVLFRSGLFVSLPWVLEFSLLLSPNLSLLLFDYYSFWTLSSSSIWIFIFCLVHSVVETFHRALYVNYYIFYFQLFNFFLQYFCIFLKFLFLVLHQLPYFIKLFVIFSIRRLFSQHHWSSYPCCSIIK